MAKLPDAVSTFADAPNMRSGRPVASYDDTSLAAGEAKAGAALEKGIEAFGAGAVAAGKGALIYQDAEDKMDLAKAQANFVTGRINLDSEFAKDTDYATAQERYTEKLDALKAQSQAIVRRDPVREKFDVLIGDNYARGIAGIKNHVFTKEADANTGYWLEQDKNFIKDAPLLPDGASRTDALDTMHAGIDAQRAKGYITAVAAQQWKERFAANYIGADAQTLIERNPAEAARRLADDRDPIYSMLDPPRRYALLHAAKNALKVGAASALATLDADVKDSQAEAYATGESTAPVPRARFDAALGHLGKDTVDRAYGGYVSELQFGRDLQQVRQMSPEDWAGLRTTHAPTPGPGYAAGLKRLGDLDRAIKQVNKEREDPAQFAIDYLPATRAAYGTFAQTQASPSATPEAKAAAARDFATKTAMEQRSVGIAPEDVTILPKGYVGHFNAAVARAADGEDPQSRVGLIALVAREGQMWGENWPAVMRQLAPESQPMVRAIAAGADTTAMTRLLSLGKDESPAKLLKEQNETKFKELTTNLNEAMAPFLRTLVGRQKDRDYTGYYNLAERLAALYVRDGMGASDAAAKAFNALIGNRYEFRDTWRIPKNAGVGADDVQVGSQIARREIAAGGTDIRPAVNDIGLTDARADSLSKFARDGVWVTSHDNAGLNLVYGDKFVRRSDGSALLLTWSDLAKRGGTAEGRAIAAESGIYGYVPQ